jgi:acetoin utilization protein AcuC
MACGLHVTWDERLTDYHFGPGHPLAPVRVELTMRLAREFGLWGPARRAAIHLNLSSRPH